MGYDPLLINFSIQGVFLMNSFKDIKGNDISFESKYDLKTDLQRDIVSHEITAYLVYHGDYVYKVDKSTYEAIQNL